MDESSNVSTSDSLPPVSLGGANAAPLPALSDTPANPSSPIPPAPSVSLISSYPLARTGYRMWASFTDALIMGIINSILYILYLFIGKYVFHNIEFIPGFVLLFIALVLICLYKMYFTVTKGATIGKDLYGLKVIQADNTQNISYKTALVREVINNVLVGIPIIGGVLNFCNYLIVFFSKRGIHDRIAHTRVVEVGPVWSMKKQLLLFLGIILLIVGIVALLSLLNPKLFKFSSKTGTYQKVSTTVSSTPGLQQ